MLNFSTRMNILYFCNPAHYFSLIQAGYALHKVSIYYICTSLVSFLDAHFCPSPWSFTDNKFIRADGKREWVFSSKKDKQLRAEIIFIKIFRSQLLAFPFWKTTQKFLCSDIIISLFEQLPKFCFCQKSAFLTYIKRNSKQKFYYSKNKFLEKDNFLLLTCD